MDTLTTTTLTELYQEVKLLKSFVIGLAGRDKEGEYRPEFVERVLKASTESPKHEFKNKKTFLSHLREK